MADHPSFNGSSAPASAFSGATSELVYLDLNLDGRWDQVDPTALTDTNGNFRFNKLETGTNANSSRRRLTVRFRSN